MKEQAKRIKAPGVRELARRLGRSPSHICRVLRGERKPSAELMRRLRAMGGKVARKRQGEVKAEK